MRPNQDRCAVSIAVSAVACAAEFTRKALALLGACRTTEFAPRWQFTLGGAAECTPTARLRLPRIVQGFT